MIIHKILNELIEFISGNEVVTSDKALIYKYLDVEQSELIFCLAGKTGSGKSTLINFLFSPEEPQEVHHGKATTREPREIAIENERGKVTVIDLPGICESVENKTNIEDYYAKYLPIADVIIWLSRVDDSADECDQLFYKDLDSKIKEKIIFGVSQLDMTRGGRWNFNGKRPGKKQLVGIGNKLDTIKENFKISNEEFEDKVVCFSCEENYNIDKLLYSMAKSANSSSKLAYKLNPELV